jgi:hypothetical protein
MMSQSLLYLGKRQLVGLLHRGLLLSSVVFGLPGQHRIFYANGRTIIHCLINVKRKVRASSNCIEGCFNATSRAVLAGRQDRALSQAAMKRQKEIQEED